MDDLFSPAPVAVPRPAGHDWCTRCGNPPGAGGFCWAYEGAFRDYLRDQDREKRTAVAKEQAASFLAGMISNEARAKQIHAWKTAGDWNDADLQTIKRKAFAQLLAEGRQ